MKKKIFLLLTILIAIGQTAIAYDFSVVVPSGQKLYFKKLSGNYVAVTFENTGYPYYTTYPTGDLVIPETVTYDDINYNISSIGSYAFYNCRGLTSVTIPDGVNSISYYAFNNCSGLSSIVIPNSVTSIESHAFQQCDGLSSVTLPASLNSIEEFAFSSCNGLTSIYSLASTPPAIGNAVFGQYGKLIYVPCGSLSNYQTANGWSNFTNIQEKVDNTVTLGDSYHGSVDVVQPTCDDNTATLTATADAGYDFVRWNDDNNDNPRSVTVVCDTTFTAYFAVSPVYTTVDSNVCENKFPITWNGVTFSGAGNETATLQSHLGGDSILTMTVNVKATSTGDTTATAYDQFTWYGHTYYQSTEEATQLFTNAVGCDSTVTLHLTIEPTPVPPSGSYQITVETDGHGNVAGGGSYDAGETVTLTATADCGYQFKQWSDGSIQNPRTISVTGDASYIAEFELATYTFETPSGQLLNYVVDCETQTACVTGYTGVCRGLLVIPPLIRIEGVLYVVVSIGPSAFEGNTGLIRVMIPARWTPSTSRPLRVVPTWPR